MNTLKKFDEFFRKLTASNSRLYKIGILEEYSQDDDIRHYLYFLLNPYITTGLSEKKLSRFDSEQDTEIENPFKTAFEALDYLQEHNTGTNETIEKMFSYYLYLKLNDMRYLFDKECEKTYYHELFRRIIGKNLPLSVDAKTVNKVMPNLIPTFDVQLANKYFDNPSIVEGREFALTTKIDGGRIIAIKKNGEAKFYTRQGQEYEGLVDLKAEMENSMPDGICLDGEITLLDPGELTSKDQYKATMKIVRKDGIKHGVKMLVFDIMTAEEFECQNCDTKYIDRRAKLDELFNAEDVTKFTYFVCLPVIYQGTDTHKIIEHLNQAIAAGDEGVMINMVDAPYEFKRTNNLLKVKKMNDIDLEIVGFEEGKNQIKGKLGSVICMYKGNPLNVGSGFTNTEIRDSNGNIIQHDERKEIWEHQDEWLGRTIVVQYFEETVDDENKPSLRFPVYLDYRTDK